MTHTPKHDELIEFEGYFRSQEFVANALGLRQAVADLELDKCRVCGKPLTGGFTCCGSECLAVEREAVISPK